MKSGKQQWEWEIGPQTSWWGTSWRELVNHKDLLVGMVRKDFLSAYQQTLLGPFWIVLQPLLQVVVYIFIFNKVIGYSTGSIPSFVFYLIGITLWNLFSEILTTTSSVITNSMSIYSKVYFPRIISPLSVLLLQLLRFSINLGLMFVILLGYQMAGKIAITPMYLLMGLPAILLTAGLGFGVGLIFSILTAKYRDLMGFLQLITRLLMFVCPVFYSLEMVPGKLKWLVAANPLSYPFELFRFSIIGLGQPGSGGFLYSLLTMIIVVSIGVLLFNKLTDKLIDVA